MAATSRGRLNKQAALRRRTVEKKLVHADPREPPRDGLLGGVPGRAEREVRHDGRRLEEDRETHTNVLGPARILSMSVFDRVQCFWKASMGPSAVENATRPTTMAIAFPRAAKFKVTKVGGQLQASAAARLRCETTAVSESAHSVNE